MSYGSGHALKMGGSKIVRKEGRRKENKDGQKEIKCMYARMYGRMDVQIK